MNWRESITDRMADHGETWDDVESHTLTDEQLDAEFNGGYGCSEGCAFTVWTKKRVYFPATYDGMEWVSSVSRHPDGVATGHVGGE
jgi:hypothetical protein